MNTNTHLNRRLFMGGQIALAASLGLGSSAFASDDKISWQKGTANQFAQLIDQQFTAVTAEGALLEMTLIEAVAGKSGPARPKNLARSESVSLVFETDFPEDLAGQEKSTRVWNATLGEAELYLSAIPRRSGGYEIEVILN